MVKVFKVLYDANDTRIQVLFLLVGWLVGYFSSKLNEFYSILRIKLEGMKMLHKLVFV